MLSPLGMLYHWPQRLALSVMAEETSGSRLIRLSGQQGYYGRGLVQSARQLFKILWIGNWQRGRVEGSISSGSPITENGRFVLRHGKRR